MILLFSPSYAKKACSSCNINLQSYKAKSKYTNAFTLKLKLTIQLDLTDKINKLKRKASNFFSNLHIQELNKIQKISKSKSLNKKDLVFYTRKDSIAFLSGNVPQNFISP